jgi:hypothetical protein
MTFQKPTAGKHRCFTSNSSILFGLGDGASVVLSLDGKINGVLSYEAFLYQVSGFGGMEYTYIEGASSWVRTDTNGSATGPDIIPITLAPTHSIVYNPGGKCQGKVSIEAEGETVVEEIGFKHKKDVWKMKGRTATLTITISQTVDDVTECVLPAEFSVEQCTAYTDTFGSDGVAFCNGAAPGMACDITTAAGSAASLACSTNAAAAYAASPNCQ